VKLVRLDEAGFALKDQDRTEPVTYSRVKK
jgi:hypothetical protein